MGSQIDDPCERADDAIMALTARARRSAQLAEVLTALRGEVDKHKAARKSAELKADQFQQQLERSTGEYDRKVEEVERLRAELQEVRDQPVMNTPYKFEVGQSVYRADDPHAPPVSVVERARLLPEDGYVHNVYRCEGMAVDTFLLEGILTAAETAYEAGD